MKNQIKLFEEKKVRTVWDEETEEWYFSIVDIVGVLTDSPNPNNYWKVLKNRLKKEGSELVTNCNQLKLQSTDGKFYKTDVANTEQLFRLIQSIPSPKAELVLNMLAELSTKQISETTNPDTFEEHANVAKKGGAIARNARMELEEQTGQKVVSA